MVGVLCVCLYGSGYARSCSFVCLYMNMYFSLPLSLFQCLCVCMCFSTCVIPQFKSQGRDFLTLCSKPRLQWFNDKATAFCALWLKTVGRSLNKSKWDCMCPNLLLSITLSQTRPLIVFSCGDLPTFPFLCFDRGLIGGLYQKPRQALTYPPGCSWGIRGVLTGFSYPPLLQREV